MLKIELSQLLCPLSSQKNKQTQNLQAQIWSTSTLVPGKAWCIASCHFVVYTKKMPFVSALIANTDFLDQYFQFHILGK